MNDSSTRTMYEAVPAAAELNKVPGFDPLQFLRRTRDSMKLDLPYQKLWFRMAHPNGRMRLTALKITEQMAVFEAMVFLDRSDAEPFSMSVAQQSAQDSRDFVKAAQNEALSQALSDAGFGIQLVSAGMPAPAQETSKALDEKMPVMAGGPVHTTPQKMLVSAPQEANKPAGSLSPSEGTKAPEKASEAAKTGQAASVPTVESAKTEPVEQHLPVEPAGKAESLPTDTIQKTEQPGSGDSQANELPVRSHVTELPVPGTGEASAGTAQDVQDEMTTMQEPAGMEASPVAEESAAAEEPSYTMDTPVEDILKVMTLEQARQVVVDNGICRGKSIAQVAQERPVSLRFYLTPGNKSRNNIVRAAAQLVLDSLQQAG